MNTTPQRVMHKAFGEGTIIQSNEVTERAPGTMLYVQFKDEKIWVDSSNVEYLTGGTISTEGAETAEGFTAPLTNLVIDDDAEFLVDKIRLTIERVLQKYINKPIGPEAYECAKREVVQFLKNMLGKNHYAKYKDNIHYSIAPTSNNDSIVLYPHNFFTALLFKGIVFMGALKGENEFVTDKGKFIWIDEKKSMGFVPAMHAQHIVVMGCVDVSNEVESVQIPAGSEEVKADVIIAEKKVEALHTRGPWRLLPYDEKNPSLIIGKEGIMGFVEIAECDWHRHTIEMDKANAKRIVDCVNACEGIENPQEAITLLREFAQQLNSGANVSINPKGAYGKLITSLFKTK